MVSAENQTRKCMHHASPWDCFPGNTQRMTTGFPSLSLTTTDERVISASQRCDSYVVTTALGKTSYPRLRFSFQRGFGCQIPAEDTA